jgi:formiminotetrahydrofolate cyclodeaminase
MATSPLGPGDISLRDFIEAVGSADTAHGAVSTAAVAGGLGSSLLLMVAALPQTRSDSVGDRAKLVEAAASLADLRQQLIETIETETAVKLFAARNMPRASAAQRSERQDAIQLALRASADVPVVRKYSPLPAACGGPGTKPHARTTRTPFADLPVSLTGTDDWHPASSGP